MSTVVYDIPVKKINGEASTLGEYAGQVTLVVNVASKCGLTKQYEALEKIYREYRDKGFVIAGFPANDFAGQEPGTNDEIQSFCQLTYEVDFPLYEKIAVTGAETHPLYQALIVAQPEAISTSDTPFREKLKGYGMTPNDAPGILWNFEKFLVARDGEVVARFSPDVTPDDPIVVEAIEKELTK